MKYNYTEDQQHAITTDASCFLLLGSAGTGKTHVLVERINYLIKETKLKPENILILTSSLNDLYNITHQLDTLIDSSNIDIYTLEMFALKVILEHEGYNKKFMDQVTLDDIKEDIIKQEMKTERKYIEYKRTPNIFTNHTARINEAFNRYILENKVSINEDYMSYAIKLLKTNKDLRTHYKNMYSHIFIDNAQDFYGEDKIFINLMMDNTQNHFIIGNDDQMIHDIDIKDTYLYDIYMDSSFERKILIDNYKTNNSIIKFATIIQHNNNRLTPNIKYMRLDHYKPNLVSLDSEEKIIDKVINDIKELTIEEDTIKADIAIIILDDDARMEVIKRLEKESLIIHVKRPSIEDHGTFIDALTKYIEDNTIGKENFFRFILNLLEGKEFAKYLKDAYTNILSIYMDAVIHVSVKSFILFIQSRAYEHVHIKKDYNVNVLTLNETKGLDFKYVFVPELSNLFTNNLEQSRRIMYNILFTARDHIYLYDLTSSHHEILDELLYIKNNWNKVKVPKSIYSGIIIETDKTYLRTEHKHLFKSIKEKYLNYPKLCNELCYLIELIQSFDKRLSMHQAPINIDIYMQAFRYFIQHTLKVTLDVVFKDKRNRIAGYLSGGSAGGFNMDRDYEQLLKMKVLDKTFTKVEFKGIHDIYRYLSATHHKNDFDTKVSKSEQTQASKNIEIYRKLSSRDKIKYFVSVIKLYDALKLTDKQIRSIEEKID